MTQPVSNCPNCGAKIVFQWSSSVQTVCQYCKSILVRTNVDLQKVGQVADLPPDSSPIQLNTEGIYRNRAFVVIGRILYEYDQGSWNEWHITMNDGTSAWFSDAQNEYAISFASNTTGLPTAAQVKVGQHLRSETGKFATLDFSDEQPALYLGEFVEFDDLKLKNLRTFEGW